MYLLWELFYTFAKIGLFTFGGGYAMISIIENQCVEKKEWISHDEMMDITVIAESTPGPIAINCATYVGYKQNGLVGSIVATLGMVLPSFMIIFLISLYFHQFLEIKWIANAFKGVKVGVGLLIIDAGVKMLKNMKNPKGKKFVVVAFVAMLSIALLSLPIPSIYILALMGFFNVMMGGKSK